MGKVVSREAQLKQLDAIGFDELEVHLAEMVHTAFRKGCEGGNPVWRAIHDMPREQWSRAVAWMLWGLRYTTGREKK